MSEEITDVTLWSPGLSEVATTEELEGLQALYRKMTAVIPGMEESGVQWRPEQIKVCHNVTSDPTLPAAAKQGDLWTPGTLLWRTKDGADEPLVVIPLLTWKSRTRFQQGDRMPDCQSENGVTAINGMKCANCPDLPFRNGVPTRCNDQSNWIVLDSQLRGIWQIRFDKTSLKAGTSMASVIQNTGKPPWESAFGLSTKMASNKAGNSWPVLQTAKMEETPSPGLQAFAMRAYQALRQARNERLDSLQLSQEQARAALAGGEEASLDGFEDTM